MIIRCISVIGKKNEPLYLKVFPQSVHEYRDLFQGEEIQYHFLVHTSLDHVEEKLAKRNSAQMNPAHDVYLGLLYDLEDLRVYGYVTATLVKFILVIETIVEPKEIEVRSIIETIYESYIQMISNAFFSVVEIDQPITSDRFKKEIENIVDKAHQKQQHSKEPKPDNYIQSKERPSDVSS